MTFTRKTTATVEGVVGAAAISLNKSLAEFKLGFVQLESLAGKLEELGLQIAQKEDRIKELSTDYVEKERQLNVNLHLKIKENAKATILEILTAEGLVTVDKDKLAALNAQVFELQTTFDDKIKAEKGKMEGILTAQFNNKEKLIVAEHNTKEANNLAIITQLQQQVTFLKEQSSKWEVALGDERKASIERAKAASVGTINVGSAERTR